MLHAVDFDGQAQVGAEQVGFEKGALPEGDWQLFIEGEAPPRLRKRLEALEKKGLGRARARSTPSSPSATAVEATTKSEARAASTPSMQSRFTLAAYVSCQSRSSGTKTSSGQPGVDESGRTIW